MVHKLFAYAYTVQDICFLFLARYLQVCLKLRRCKHKYYYYNGKKIANSKCNEC